MPEPPATVVPPRPDGSLPLLFFIHSADRNVMGYVNIVRHPGWEQPASGVRDLGRMPLSPVGLLDTIAPDFIQELRVSDDEIWLRPAETVFSFAPRPPRATEVAR